jgi:hypothetical protein
MSDEGSDDGPRVLGTPEVDRNQSCRRGLTRRKLDLGRTCVNEAVEEQGFLPILSQLYGPRGSPGRWQTAQMCDWSRQRRLTTIDSAVCCALLVRQLARPFHLHGFGSRPHRSLVHMGGDQSAET